MSVERRFESLLRSSRLVVLVAVLGSLVVALATFYVTTMPVDAWAALRGQTVAHVVEVVDRYPLAAS